MPSIDPGQAIGPRRAAILPPIPEEHVKPKPIDRSSTPPPRPPTPLSDSDLEANRSSASPGERFKLKRRFFHRSRPQPPDSLDTLEPPRPVQLAKPDPEKYPPEYPGKPSVLHKLFPPFPDAPTPRLFFTLCGFDIFTQILCNLLALALYLYGRPVMTRYFPYYHGISHNSWGLRHGMPLLPEYVSTGQSAVMSFFLPAIIIGLLGMHKVRSFWDTNAALMGLGYALSTASLFQVLIKIFIGGLRPHFIDVCKPQIPSNMTGVGPGHVYFHALQICTAKKNHKLSDAQMSFPSGHSAAAFGGFGFLALYLGSKLGVFHRHDSRQEQKGQRNEDQGGNASRRTSRNITPLSHASTSSKSASSPWQASPHWKLVAFGVPWLIAIVISGSKVRDGWHHATDVLVGAKIGLVFAIWAYRMVYQGASHDISREVMAAAPIAVAKRMVDTADRDQKRIDGQSERGRSTMRSLKSHRSIKSRLSDTEERRKGRRSRSKSSGSNKGGAEIGGTDADGLPPIQRSKSEEQSRSRPLMGHRRVASA
ncbi:PAP2-domain-containing protein [Corynespora cassiicola Philippines]|uniref:PAP2-domain-containing protein n=1 Tax=Corynespora cassiicola Philippines TaxID=1448308 RepID=A0A2T2PA57_CORCC|nr:PAP2-domain-containing protein [Corynespora cassiicola Philippines]